MVFDTETTADTIGFSVIVFNITAIGFVSNLTIYENTIINELRYMYIAISQ